MIIHFGGPSFGIEKRIKLYRGIINLIHELDHNIAHDWIEPAYHKALKSQNDSQSHLIPNWEAVCAMLEDSINRCDIAIIYAAPESYMGVGYQIALALQKNKPVLVIREKEDITTIFITGVRNPLLTLIESSADTLEDNIKSFITQNDVNLKDLRFNFVIDRQIHNYLKWLSYDSGKTKAEIVRDLIMEDLEKDS